MEWAAHYHHRACLEQMIRAMKEEKLGYTYLHFLQAAVHSADKFSMVLRNGIAYMDRFKDTMDYLLEETHRVSFATGIGAFGYTLLYYAVSEAHDLAVEYLLSDETEQLLQSGWEKAKEAANEDSDIPVRRYGTFSREHINIPCGDEQRTPLLECVRWNRRKLFDLLVSNGADVTARSRNPFNNTKTDWSALHTFAHAGHNSDVSLADQIIEAGVPADAQMEGSSDLEPPLLVALKNNAYNLAELLLGHGADLNRKCISSGLIALEHPTTILGHLVASTARESASRIRFVLSTCRPAIRNEKEAEAVTTIDTIVEPERSLTAIHRAAWAYKGVFDRSPDGTSPPKPVKRANYDFAQNREIMYELLQHLGGSGSQSYLNARTGEALLRRTALHLAVDAVNVRCVELLLDTGAVDVSLEDAQGRTALDLAIQGARHAGIKCDGPCKQIPLPSRRWHCIICPDHDLCDACRGALDTTASPGEHEHEFREVTLSETCADISAKSKWRVLVPEEMEDMAEIIDLLQARQAINATQAAFASLGV